MTTAVCLRQAGLLGIVLLWVAYNYFIQYNLQILSS